MSNTINIGNDRFQLLHFESTSQWVHWAKACEIEGVGAIVQVATQQVKGQFTQSVVFVPGVRVVPDDAGGRKLVRLPPVSVNLDAASASRKRRKP